MIACRIVGGPDKVDVIALIGQDLLQFFLLRHGAAIAIGNIMAADTPQLDFFTVDIEPVPVASVAASEIEKT